MKNYIKILFVLLLLMISFLLTFAQSSKEVLIDIERNNEIEQFVKKRKLLKSSLLRNDTLSLPFIDDFSSTKVYPDPNLWFDDLVYINSTYANNPISIGIATFDALDSNGKIYEHANSNVFLADSLTSRPIDLDFPVDSNIYISFLYQPGGIGNPPEIQDVLILQFYAPQDSAWLSVWSASYSKEDSLVAEIRYLENNTTIWEPNNSPTNLFRHVIIPVNDTMFLKKGFQFRFRNYASISNVTYLTSLKGNSDLWHIDYLKLDKGRSSNDTLLYDVAFITPFSSMLLPYESIPWTHYNSSIENSLFHLPSIIHKNNSPDGNTSTSGIAIKITDILGNNPNFISDSVGYELGQFEEKEIIFDPPINYSFANSNSQDSANFQITFSLDASQNEFLANDSLFYNQIFKNFYAYDDGSAEYGYGVYGEGTRYAQIACKFNNYDTSDTLRGVMMFFNNTFENASEKYFYLGVWDHNDTVPGDLLILQEGAKPEYNGINQFTTYIFDEPITVSETFYVGWMKTSEETINIGFDMNRINNDKVYYNLDGTWKKSEVEGTIMIRPIFSKSILTNVLPSLINTKFNHYPNPANDMIYMDNLPDKNYVVQLFDNVGRKVFEKNAPVSYINLSGFTSGMYHIRITDFKTFISNQKLMIVR